MVTSEDCTPQQIHLSLGKKHKEMYVSWKTEGSSCLSHVTYWLDGSQMGSTLADAPSPKNSVGYSFLLTESDMCSTPALRAAFAVQVHRAALTGLVPGAVYRYQVGGSDAPLSFRAPPAPSPDARVTLAAFGDLGDSIHACAKSPGAASTLHQLRRDLDDLDAILHVGDISYADGKPDVWDTFMDGIEPLASRVPYMVMAGNHEVDYLQGSDSDPSGEPPYHPDWGNYGHDSGGECGVMLARRFHMPHARLGEPLDPNGAADAAADADAGAAAAAAAAGGSVSKRERVPNNAPFWYGFDYGSVHVSVVSTEHDITPGSRQHRWLEDELAAVDRCITPWLLVMLHRPMYVVYPHKSNRVVGDHLRDSLEHLFKAYMVDAAVSGHVHSYYRTCPVHKEACTDNDGGGRKHGTVHIVVGSAGRKLSDVERGQEEWCVAKESTWGYARLRVRSAERMVVEFVESETGKVLDKAHVVASPQRLTATSSCRGRGGARGVAAEAGAADAGTEAEAVAGAAGAAEAEAEAAEAATEAEM